ncbi:hypothetical protein F4703DRAFT_1799759 [Phycomyces blakesleeanus]
MDCQITPDWNLVTIANAYGKGFFDYPARNFSCCMIHLNRSLQVISSAMDLQSRLYSQCCKQACPSARVYPRFLNILGDFADILLNHFISKSCNLITQTSGESNDEFNVNFSNFEYEANLARYNNISRPFATLANAEDLSSDGQYDLRDFVLEENIFSHARLMDVDIDFNQDISTGIESPLEVGPVYFCVCNVVEHRESLNQHESVESD